MTKVYENLLKELDAWGKSPFVKPHSFSLEETYGLIHCYAIPYQMFAIIHIWDYAHHNDFFYSNKPAMIYTLNDHKLYGVSVPEEWEIPSLWSLSKEYNETFAPLYVKWLKSGEIAKIYTERRNEPIDDYERMGDRSLISLKRSAKNRLIKEILGLDLWSGKFAEYALFLPKGEDYHHDTFAMRRLAFFAAGTAPEEMLREEITTHHYRDQAVELVKEKYKDELLTPDELHVAKALGFLLSQYPYAVNIAVEVENKNITNEGTTSVMFSLEELMFILTDGCLAWNRATTAQKNAFRQKFDILAVDVQRFLSFEYRQKRYEIK